jgi:hypothetical protein
LRRSEPERRRGIRRRCWRVSLSRGTMATPPVSRDQAALKRGSGRNDGKNDTGRAGLRHVHSSVVQVQALGNLVDSPALRTKCKADKAKIRGRNGTHGGAVRRIVAGFEKLLGKNSDA